jgi:hypothetical protein
MRVIIVVAAIATMWGLIEAADILLTLIGVAHGQRDYDATRYEETDTSTATQAAH